MTKKYSLMVARFPGNQSEHPDSSGWLMRNLAKFADAADPVKPWKLGDTPITMSRNRAVKHALKRGYDYLLMLDSDMAPDVESDGQPFFDVAWDFMMRRRVREEQRQQEILNGDGRAKHFWVDEHMNPWAVRDVAPATIAAPYCGPAPDEPVYVMRWSQSEPDTVDLGLQLGMIDRDDAARRSGIEEVAALPTGLILYDTRVFRILPPPWFDYEYADPPYNTRKCTTEDIFQTRNASLLGLPQYVAWDCWAGHHKLKCVRKPRPITADLVADRIAQAVVRGYRSDEKLHFVEKSLD